MGSLRKKSLQKHAHPNMKNKKIWGAGQNECLKSLPPSMLLLWTSQCDFSGAHSDIKQRHTLQGCTEGSPDRSCDYNYVVFDM